MNSSVKVAETLERPFWDAAKKSLDVARKRVNLSVLNRIKALCQKGLSAPSQCAQSGPNDSIIEGRRESFQPGPGIFRNFPAISSNKQ